MTSTFLIPAQRAHLASNGFAVTTGLTPAAETMLLYSMRKSLHHLHPGTDASVKHVKAVLNRLFANPVDHQIGPLAHTEAAWAVRDVMQPLFEELYGTTTSDDGITTPRDLCVSQQTPSVFTYQHSRFEGRPTKQMKRDFRASQLRTVFTSNADTHTQYRMEACPATVLAQLNRGVFEPVYTALICPHSHLEVAIDIIDGSHNAVDNLLLEPNSAVVSHWALSTSFHYPGAVQKASTLSAIKRRVVALDKDAPKTLVRRIVIAPNTVVLIDSRCLYRFVPPVLAKKNATGVKLSFVFRTSFAPVDLLSDIPSLTPTEACTLDWSKRRCFEKMLASRGAPIPCHPTTNDCRIYSHSVCGRGTCSPLVPPTLSPDMQKAVFQGENATETATFLKSQASARYIARHFTAAAGDATYIDQTLINDILTTPALHKPIEEMACCTDPADMHTVYAMQYILRNDAFTHARKATLLAHCLMNLHSAWVEDVIDANEEAGNDYATLAALAAAAVARVAPMMNSLKRKRSPATHKEKIPSPPKHKNKAPSPPKKPRRAMNKHLVDDDDVLEAVFAELLA